MSGTPVTDTEPERRDADPEPAPADAASPGPEGAGQWASDWRDGLPPALRRVAEKFPTPADAVKSYAALERRLGRSVTLPGDDASQAEIDAFHARLGRPDTPQGYDIRLPDGLPDHLRPGAGDAAARAAFLAAMHRAGASPATVQAAFDWYYATAMAADDGARQAHARDAAEAETALRRDWGADYDRNVALADRALRQFGDDALAESAERAGLTRHPAWLRAFARIGRATSEDGLLAGDGDTAVEDARQRIDAIMAEHFGRTSYGDAAVQDELRALYGALYGTGEAGADFP